MNTTTRTTTAQGASPQDIDPPPFASLAVRAQNALTATGVDARYLTISLVTMNVGIHGPGYTGPGSVRNFTREQAQGVARAFGAEDPTYDDQGERYAAVSGRTRDGITLDVYCFSNAEEEA